MLRSAVIALSLCLGAQGFMLPNANNRSPLRHGTTTAAVRACWGLGLGLRELGMDSTDCVWVRGTRARRRADSGVAEPLVWAASEFALARSNSKAPMYMYIQYNKRPPPPHGRSPIRPIIKNLPPQRAAGARGQLRMSAAVGGASSVPKARVGILGASGYTGAELVSRGGG